MAPSQNECAYFNCVDTILPRHYSKDVLPFLKTPAHVTLFYEVKADLREQEMAFLQDRGRLFEEDDRFMSLVLPGHPSAPSPVIHKKSELPIVGTKALPQSERQLTSEMSPLL